MVTVISTDDGKALTKTHQFVNGRVSTTQYDKAYKISADIYDVSDINQFHELLTILEQYNTYSIIHGELIDPSNNKDIQRTKKKTQKHEAYFKNPVGGTKWIMIDFDDVENTYDFQENEDRLEFLISLLPRQFWDVTYHYQWSSSAGLPRADGSDPWNILNCHIWFWLDAPIDLDDLREWAKKQKEETGYIDPSVVNAVQLNYTANPIFKGFSDPIITTRSGIMNKDNLTVKIKMPGKLAAIRKQIATNNTVKTTFKKGKKPKDIYHNSIFDSSIVKTENIDNYNREYCSGTRHHSLFGALRSIALRAQNQDFGLTPIQLASIAGELDRNFPRGGKYDSNYLLDQAIRALSIE